MTARLRPLALPLLVGGVMVGLEVLDWLIGFYSFDNWGVVSWSLQHLPGIALMPLLHGGFSHLLSNLLPFLVFGLILAARGEFARIGILGTLGSGALVWLWPNTGLLHVGASGLVLCFFTYLIVKGIRTRQPYDLVIALGLGLFYGLSMWATLTNFSQGISWQGHVAGALVGGGLAWFSAKGPQRG